MPRYANYFVTLHSISCPSIVFANKLSYCSVQFYTPISFSPKHSETCRRTWLNVFLVGRAQDCFYACRVLSTGVCTSFIRKPNHTAVGWTDRHQRHQALIAVPHERKKAWVVKVDDHSTKAKYCVIRLYNRTGMIGRKVYS